MVFPPGATSSYLLDAIGGCALDWAVPSRASFVRVDLSLIWARGLCEHKSGRVSWLGGPEARFERLTAEDSPPTFHRRLLSCNYCCGQGLAHTYFSLRILQHADMTRTYSCSLPNEIWAMVLQYLPLEDCKQFRSANHKYLDIATPICFRTLAFDVSMASLRNLEFVRIGGRISFCFQVCFGALLKQAHHLLCFPFIYSWRPYEHGLHHGDQGGWRL